jgi:hypothetical protein
MPAETARQFEALEAQAQTLMSHFIKAGYEAVAPAIIQPAGVFLDVIGEQLRARTYVFTDQDGEELRRAGCTSSVTPAALFQPSTATTGRHSASSPRARIGSIRASSARPASNPSAIASARRRKPKQWC